MWVVSNRDKCEWWVSVSKCNLSRQIKKNADGVPDWSKYDKYMKYTLINFIQDSFLQVTDWQAFASSAIQNRSSIVCNGLPPDNGTSVQ